MKVKQFTAPNTTLALTQIREELGDEAIIVSTATIDDGVCVTVAVEDTQNIDFDKQDNLEISPSLQVYDDIKLRDGLDYHDVLPEVAGQILAVARQQYQKLGINNQKKLLMVTFNEMYSFASLFNDKQKNKVFMGIPGCGKSTVIAKAATKAKYKGIKSCIISTDNVRAGANSQLKAFAEILQTDFYFCPGARELFSTVNAGQQNYDLLLIDTPGINPYIDAEIEKNDELLDSIKADRILVQDAGHNTKEAIEIAEIFVSMGVNMILPTRLDMTRRIGSVLSAAYCNHLSFCAGSVSGNIAKGLADITSEGLAKLLLTQ